MNNQFEPHQSSFKLDANVVILIAYFGSVLVSFIPGINALAWLVPLIIFLIEKDSKFVKFHAMQALLLEIAGVVLVIVLGIIIGIIGTLSIISGSMGLFGLAGITTFVTFVIPILLLVFSILAAVKGWNYECYKLPLIGKLSEKITLK